MIVELNGKTYRCTRVPVEGSDFGTWEVLLGGSFRRVINYGIRSALSKLLKSQLHENTDKNQ